MPEDRKTLHLELTTHRVITSFLYILGFYISLRTIGLAYAENNTTIVLIISTGAILATFGSALSTIGCTRERDLLERILTSIDILFTDILKQNKWRRWPFLQRSERTKTLNGNTIHQHLKNPKIPLNVGTHEIAIDIPTVLEDFFDLPLLQNVYQLAQYRKAARTTLLGSNINTARSSLSLPPGDEYMAYECIYSTWKSITEFRLFRYLIHFGAGLTLFGGLVTLHFVLLKTSTLYCYWHDLKFL